MKRFSHYSSVPALPLSAMLFMAVLFCLPGQALAAKRVALVIGNGGYKSSPSLKNPVNDARDVASALRGVGFDVILKTDVPKRAMLDSVREFGRKAGGAEVALFYYAGHGMQLNGVNYLIPLNADVRVQDEVEYEAVDANRILTKMESAKARVNIVVLDACRDNPFSSFRSTSRGLAMVKAVKGSVIVYATAPGEVAADGSGRNSPFTRNFLKYVNMRGLAVDDLFQRVGAGVSRETNGRQSPWINSCLYDDFYLVADGSPTPPAPTGRKASLKIETQPSGATVYVNGSRQGAAPVNVTNVSPGRVTVRAVKSGYKAMERTVRLEAGQSMYLPLALDREAPQTARLTVRPDPSGARVRILNIGSGYRDGMELAPGRYHVEVAKSGYEKFSSWITLGAGENMVMPVSLKRVQQAAAPRPSPSSSSPGKTWTDPTTGMEFVWVPGGCFKMGSPASESGRDDDEMLHEVCVDGFWMGKYEVTNAQYRRYKSGHSSKSYKGNSLNGNNQPVVYVSWKDATGYARWLSGKGNGTFRLPTEAEWEYAARAGTTTARFWGDIPDQACTYANVRDLLVKSKLGLSYIHNCDDGFAVAAPVGSFLPNGYGLYDMIGNVSEWCQDWYGKDYYSQSPGKNPQGPGGGSNRVLRGGNWRNIPGFVRSAYRGWTYPIDANFLRGFRLLRAQ